MNEKFIEWIKIKLTEKEKENLIKLEKTLTKANKIKKIRLILLKNEQYTNKELIKIIWVSYSTITKWLKLYKEWWVEKLLEEHYKEKPLKINKEQIEELKKDLKEKPCISSKEVCHLVKIKFGISYSISWMREILKKNWI